MGQAEKINILLIEKKNVSLQIGFIN